MICSQAIAPINSLPVAVETWLYMVLFKWNETSDGDWFPPQSRKKMKKEQLVLVLKHILSLTSWILIVSPTILHSLLLVSSGEDDWSALGWQCILESYNQVNKYQVCNTNNKYKLIFVFLRLKASMMGRASGVRSNTIA
jgi:hypothetical protein